MKLLALDQSSRITGFSIWEDDELVKSGTVDIGSISDLGERLNYLRNWVINLIEDNDIDYFAFEDIQLQGNVANNVKTFKTLAEVFGVMHELSVSLQIPYEAVLASSWKSSLGIKGRNRAEQKRNAQTFILNKYSLKVTQDEADAICIGAYVTKNAKPCFDWSE